MKKSRRKYKSRGPPPNTVRFCPCCDKETTWKYNRNIGHSECDECGGRNYKIPEV